MRELLLAAGVAWAGAARAQEAPAPPDRSSEESALFGGDPAPEPSPETAPEAPTSPATRDDAAMSAPGTTDASIAQALGAADDRLTIGGRLYLRLDALLPEGAAGPEEVDLASPSPTDLFVDVRPNDRVRGYVRGRLTTDWTVPAGAVDPFTGEERDQVAAVLDQGWVKFDIARKVYATVGRQRLKWGAGRFWNPTDFLNQQVLSPLEVFDLRTGVDLVKLHVPYEGSGSNLYAIANLEGADSLADVGGAVRAEVLVGHTEITASAAARRDQPLRLGADLSSGVGPLDLHLEGAVAHGGGATRYTGTFAPAEAILPTSEDVSGDWIPQIVGGGEVSVKYSGEDSISFGAEGFYNGAGYDSAKLLPWLFATGDYKPLYAGRWYAAGYAYLPSPGRWNDHAFTASALGNLSDGSWLARLDHRATVLTHLAINEYVAYHFGADGELHYRVQVPALPGVPGLEQGIDEAAPLLDFGVGASVSF